MSSSTIKHINKFPVFRFSFLFLDRKRRFLVKSFLRSPTNCGNPFGKKVVVNSKPTVENNTKIPHVATNLKRKLRCLRRFAKKAVSCYWTEYLLLSSPGINFAEWQNHFYNYMWELKLTTTKIIGFYAYVLYNFSVNRMTGVKWILLSCTWTFLQPNY